MTETQLDASPYAAGVTAVREHPDVERLRAMLDEVSELRGDPGKAGAVVDGDRIEMLRLMEEIKGGLAAAQARGAVEFEVSQLAQQDDVEVEARMRGRGISDQVALARGCAASQGARHLGFAKAMQEMPHTMALLTRGQVDEWTATVLVRETAVLTLEDRQLVDERLCALRVDTATGEIGQPWVLGRTPRRVEYAARALGNELDPEAAVRRASRARDDRRVSIRPTPDTMTYLTALLSVQQGVACWASLHAAAKTSKATGDERTVAQIMADVLVQRLTGQSTAEAVPAEIQLVMTPDTLIGASERPARIGDCVVPAATARDLAGRADAPRWLRRVFVDPVTEVVTAVDSRRRRFGPEDVRFLDLRDQHCRQPRCDGAITDHDHVDRAVDGGPTTRPNGQGLCEAHNLVKEVPGWRSRVTDARPGQHTVEITTPTGHVYRSQAPPGLPPPL